MKKCLTLLCVLVLMMSVAVSASAVAAKLSSTQAFLAVMDASEITYTVVGMDDDGDERVKISFVDGTDFSYDINLFFDPNEENCYIRVWNIIEYADVDFAKVLRSCNSLNDNYNFVTFSADESDNTVTLDMDLIYRSHDVGEIANEAILRITSILEEAYPTLAVYGQ